MDKLFHIGVKGMKWGHRKSEQSSETDYKTEGFTIKKVQLFIEFQPFQTKLIKVLDMLLF